MASELTFEEFARAIRTWIAEEKYGAVGIWYEASDDTLKLMMYVGPTLVFKRRSIEELHSVAIDVINDIGLRSNGAVIEIPGTDTEVSVTDLLSRKLHIPFDSEIILVVLQQIYARFGDTPVPIEHIQQLIADRKIAA